MARNKDFQNAVVEVIKAFPGSTMRQIASFIEVKSDNAIASQLSMLYNKGRITREMIENKDYIRSKGGNPKVYAYTYLETPIEPKPKLEPKRKEPNLKLHVIETGVEQTLRDRIEELKLQIKQLELWKERAICVVTQIPVLRCLQ